MSDAETIQNLEQERAYLRELIGRFRSTHGGAGDMGRCFCNLCDRADDLLIAPLSEYGDMEAHRFACHETDADILAFDQWDDWWWEMRRRMNDWSRKEAGA